MATINEVYNNWRVSLKKPYDSLFYYHPNLERILLGFSIFVLSSRPLMTNLGKAESLKLLQIYIPDLITAWIDENEKAFETMFPLTIKIAEMYTRVALAFANEYPSKSKQLNKLAMFFSNATAIAGDMNEEKANEFLDDLSSDGKTLYSDQITAFGNQIFFLTTQYGMDIPPTKLVQIIGL